MEVTVKLADDKAVQEAVSEAILRTLDETSRNTLIKDAIKHLMTPDPNGYPKGMSPLQQIFHRAVDRIATKTIEESLDQDTELVGKLKELHREAVNKIFDDPDTRKDIVEKHAAALRKAITGDRY